MISAEMIGEIMVSLMVAGMVGLVASIVSFAIWINKNEANRKRDEALIQQRMTAAEGKLQELEQAHRDMLNTLNEKADKTLESLSNIHLAFSELRVRNQEHERRLEKLETKNG